jgi:hypothetical protein
LRKRRKKNKKKKTDEGDGIAIGRTARGICIEKKTLVANSAFDLGRRRITEILNRFGECRYYCKAYRVAGSCPTLEYANCKVELTETV